MSRPIDTDQSTASAHHTIGTGSRQAAAGDHGHTGYASTSHTHVESDVTSLVTDLAAKLVKANNLSDVANTTTARTNLGAAATSHTHAESDVTSLVTDLAALPKGRMASANSLTVMAAITTTAETVYTGVGNVTFTSVANRRYRVTGVLTVSPNTNGQRVAATIRDGGASAVTNAALGTIKTRHNVSATAVSVVHSVVMSYEIVPDAGGTVHNLALTGLNPAGSSTNTLVLGDATNPSYLMVEDVGT